ncbi:MAG: GNAT family N-acetyltransferase [Microgenomates group bacterium]|nr:GNAT family N-acetyltransferase [Microgenomates group bacterium]
MIKYKQNKASLTAIKKHLKICQFVPPLDTYTNLDNYSKKIITFAERFEAWDKNKFIGLVAVYYNDFSSKKGFITVVGINPNYVKQRIATKLLKKVIEYGKRKKFKKIDLEVKTNNIIALKLYKKLGFKMIKKGSPKSYMSLKLS